MERTEPTGGGPGQVEDNGANGETTATVVEIDTGELAALHRRVAELEERNLNATDALIGAQAAAAQARREIDGIFHRLHVREQELQELKELLGHELNTPNEEIIRELSRNSRLSGRTTRRRSVRSRPRR